MRRRRRSKGAAMVAVGVAVLAACSGGARPSPGSLAATADVTTAAPAPLTPSLPPAPIVPADLWPVAAGGGLLTPAADGSTPFPSLAVGVPSGPVGSTDVTALVVQTQLRQQVAFEARLVSGLVRRAVLGLHGTDANATAWVATRALRIDPAETPTPAVSSLPGAAAILHRPVGDTVSTIEVVVARGPVSVAAEVRQRIAEPTVEPAALAEADALVAALVARVDERIARCTDPCTGTGGPVPASAERPVLLGECANRTAPGTDFQPAPFDSAPAPCTQPHAFHVPVVATFGDDPRVYETVTTATPADHPALVLATACRTAAVQWMTATAYVPGPGGAFSVRAQLPARAVFDAGARVAGCVLSPADTSSPAAALNPLPG